MITVIGLGVQKGDLSKRGEELLLKKAKAGVPVFVRTAKTKSYQTVLDLGVAHTCLDDVYEKSRSFATLAKNLAKRVADGGENAVYLVDGSATEDNSVKALAKKLRGKIEIVDGVSKVTAIVQSAGFFGCSYTAVSAYELEEKATAGNLALPLVVYDLDDRGLASDVKLLLGNLYGEETTAQYIQDGKAKKIHLFALDRQNAYDYTSAVAIEEQALLEKTRFSLADLKEIIVRLRAPNGCPWDRVQTPESIKMSAVEEAYELLDAIDAQDDDKILEETGDILLQAVFHAVMKEETGAFDLTDVVTGVCQKLITRHTHVFGEDKAGDETSALSVWEKNKMTEKGQDTFAKAVNDVPKCFPALLQAQKIAKRLEKGGWGFAKDFDGVEEKLREELSELKKAYAEKNTAHIQEELGDVLMCMAWLGRVVGADCEESLLTVLAKVKARYTAFENAVIADGKDVNALTDEEWQAYYKKAKRGGQVCD